MLMHAIGVLPLISRLKNPELHKQNWYADDSSCAGSPLHIKEWFMRLLELGSSYACYFTEHSKSIIVVKEQHLQEAKAIFFDLQVEVVLASRFLGSCVGDEAGVRQYTSDKVDEWVRSVERLAGAAKSYPQSAYDACIPSPSSGPTFNGFA